MVSKIEKLNLKLLVCFFFFFCEITLQFFQSLENILSVNEKLPVSKFLYFEKYIIQLFGYCYVYVSNQWQAGLER